MISIEEALSLYAERVSTLKTETVAVHSALHRVLAADAHSQADMPRFDQSAMDGYAFRATDSNTPLPIVATSAAGHWPESSLEASTAWRIYTGAAVPEGADTVIPQERVQRVGDSLHFEAAYPAGKNIRYRGEEIAKGTLLAQQGQRLTPGTIASLRNGGLEQVEVFRRPRISLLVTGDEVRSPGSELKDGDIPDSNGPYVQNWLLAHGYEAPEVIYVSDESDTVETYLRLATATSDLIITTGGASVGDRDFIPDTAKAIGFEEVFWRVAQKPGKPLFFGVNGKQALLGLPGNPGAVLVGMEIHGRCILNQMQGLSNANPAWRIGLLSEEVAADSRRDRLVRMFVDQDAQGQCQLHPLGNQDSHMLSNLQQANVLAHLPSKPEAYPAGTPIRFIPLT